jgi:hypothetical protein
VKGFELALAGLASSPSCLGDCDSKHTILGGSSLSKGS